jgi:hypothetical protein
MTVITSGAHPKALWPGVNAWFGAAYKEHPTEYTEIFDTEASTMQYEEDVQHTGFNLAPVLAEGGAVTYDSHTQGYVKRYTHVAYGLGYIVTRIEMDDNQYEKLSKSRAQSLARAMRRTKETVAANILNRAETSGYTGGDGKTLLATDHPSVAGDWSNKLAVAADLSEAALEDLLIQVMTATDERGGPMALQARKLIIPPQYAFTAARILKSVGRTDTANNDINALKAMGALPDGVVVNHYLSDSDAWFVKTDCPHGLKHFQRTAMEFTKDNDFDTSNAKAKAFERYSFGWTDPHAIYGSMGS